MTDTGYSHNLRMLPDGTYQAVFPKGIELPVAIGGPEAATAQNRIQWVTEDGALVATLTGAVIDNPVLDGSIAALSANHAEDPELSATLSLQALRNNGVDSPVVGANAGSEFVTIINGDGYSDFARASEVETLTSDVAAIQSDTTIVRAAGPFEIATGAGGVAFSGDHTAYASVVHGLGRTPRWGAITGFENSGGDLHFNIVGIGYDAAYTDDYQITFNVQAFDVDTPLVGTWGFSWIAMG